ncbi:protein NDRG1-like isoform X1 [Scyliorhinus canicula]|uniref:protein NDRG1-like isoform X1 n=1 Tax=Scyliorhinus canicula TaxID=7830 RepID=UPI0018F36CA5|nr:protein NDRG1-like isoform X1 [Scyliorhinus canicula]XP_038664734.1 protein NDRG1-like isoform X1 [Scyliorhinus canicula]XP_038664735.1 protein NDRG1-like isoform X1 [Scyliorhinus canicula]XP_038664736.1 protein NDRG1-like isoform X1 [Scyliorhinus canicula]XP_038664737.1 protein NDRG1-like isoform X1 [Scyliorhinus canicula]
MSLRDIQLSEIRQLLVDNSGFGEANARNFQVLETQEHDVETPFGVIRVAVRGTPKGSRPVILTFHDIGMNYKSCFNALFNSEDMQEITLHFAVYHINAPGQQEGAPTFPNGYQYPSMDQMSEMLPAIMKQFGIKSIIGIGVGAGAYILTKFALTFPDLVEGLCLININCCAEGWMDWAATKITGWTSNLTDVVISHLFGKDEMHSNPDLIQLYRSYITSDINHNNLQLFVDSYNSRRDLDIERPLPAGHHHHHHNITLQCPALLVVGDASPAVDAVVDCNTKLDPTKTTLLKMSDCGGMPQVVQPAKLTEAFKYFVQGMGYMPAASMTRLMRSRSASGSSVEGNRSRAHTGEASKIYSHPAMGLNQNTNANSNTNVGGVETSGPQSTEISC